MIINNEAAKKRLSGILSQRDDEWFDEFIQAIGSVKHTIEDYGGPLVIAPLFNKKEMTIEMLLDEPEYSDALSAFIDAVTIEEFSNSSFEDLTKELRSIRAPDRAIVTPEARPTPSPTIDIFEKKKLKGPTFKEITPEELRVEELLTEGDVVPTSSVTKDVDEKGVEGADPRADKDAYMELMLHDEIKIRFQEALEHGIPWFETQNEYTDAVISGGLEKNSLFSGPWKVKQDREGERKKKTPYGSKRIGEFEAPSWVPKEVDSLSARYEEALISGEDVGKTTFYSVFADLGEAANIFDVSAPADEDIADIKVLLLNESWEAVKSAVILKLEDIELRTKGFDFTRSSDKEMRLAMCSELDDLVAGIKQWDSGNASKKSAFKERGIDTSDVDAYVLSDLFLDRSSEFSSKLAFLVRAIVFPWMTKEHLVKKRIHEASRNKENYYDAFYGYVQERIHEYVGKSFDVRSDFYRNNYFSAGALKRINIAFVNRAVHQSIERSEKKVKHWTQIECTVCGKNIRYNKLNSADEKDKWSEYSYDEYSLFREDNRGNRQMILPEELEAGIGEYGNFPHPSAELMPATWPEIQDMIYSSEKNKHAEGVLRRAHALKLLGGKKLSGNVSIFNRRYKCPYQSGECGASINPIDAIASTEDFDINRVSVVGGTKGVEKYLEAAMGAGEINKDIYDVIIKRLSRLKSGGYKFSNSFFRCPHKIDVDAEKPISDYKKYDYLAMPHAGPVTSDKLDAGMIHPPAYGNAESYSLEEGTCVYLVCGALTSLSSFVRSNAVTESGEQAPGLDVILSSVSSNQSPEMAIRIIEQMIRYGVDINDITPFINNIQNLSNIGREEISRMDKMSQLLATAMARSVEYESRQLVGPIALKCRHGHVFTINQSLMFADTHMGTRLSQSASKGKSVGARGSLTWESIANSKILSYSGLENFYEAKKLKLINDHILSGERIKSDLLTYEDWSKLDLGSGSIKRISFSDPHGNGLYSQGGYSMSPNIWNPERTVDPTIRKEKGTEEEISIAEDVMSRAESDVINHGDGGQTSKSDLAQAAAGLMGQASIPDAIKPSYLDRVIGNVSATLKVLLSNMISWNSRAFSSSRIDKSQFSDKRICCEEDLPLLMTHAKEFFKDLVSSGAFEIAFVDAEDNRDMTIEDSFFNGLSDKFVEQFEARIVEQFKGLDLNLARNYYEYGAESIYRVMDQGVVGILNDVVIEYSDSSIDYIDFSDYVINEFGGIDQYVPNFVRSNDNSKSISNILFPASSSEMGDNATEWAERSMLCSSAHYIADYIAKLSDIYLTKDNSEKYIGYNIGIGASSLDAVLKLEYSDLEKIVSSINEVVDSLLIIELADSGEDGLDRVRNEKLVDMVKNINELNRALLIDIPSGMDRASSSYRYLNMSNEYIKNGLEERISESDNADAKDILNNLYDSPPIATISLSNKHVYYSQSGNIFGVPVYRSYVAKHKSSKKEHVVIKTLKNGYLTFSHKSNPPEDSSEDTSYHDLISKHLIERGYVVFFLSREKYVAGRPNDVSMIYHPHTYPVRGEDGQLEGFRNDEVGLDTTSGFSFGRVGKRAKRDSVFPPNPSTHLGAVGIPLNFRGSTNASAFLKTLSITDSNIPVEIPIPGSDVSKHFDLTYLLSRDKSSNDGLSILKEIDDLYDDMNEEIVSVSANRGLSKDAKEKEANRVRERYRGLISQKHERYKALPVHVLASSCATKCVSMEGVAQCADSDGKAGVYEVDTKPWIPMVDWYTAYNIVTKPQYGPEFGGHSLWESGSDQSREDSISAMVNFISKTNNLSGLVDLLNSHLSSSKPFVASAPTVYPAGHPNAGRPYIVVTESDLFMGIDWIKGLVIRHGTLNSEADKLEQKLLENSLFVIKRITKYNFIVPLGKESSADSRRVKISKKSELGSGVDLLDLATEQLNDEDITIDRSNPWAAFSGGHAKGLSGILDSAAKSIHDKWDYESGMLYSIYNDIDPEDGGPISYIRFQTSTAKGNKARVHIGRGGQKSVTADEWVRMVQSGETREMISRIVHHIQVGKSTRGYSSRLSKFLSDQIISSLASGIKHKKKSNRVYSAISKNDEKYYMLFDILQRRKSIERMILSASPPRL